jgi:hypothetical protein
MEFQQTFSKQFLQGIPTETLRLKRISAIKRCVESVGHHILAAAVSGHTRYTVEVKDNVTYDGYKVTTADLIEGLTVKFPGCSIEVGESWDPDVRNPNQMNRKSGIIIDWS